MTRGTVRFLGREFLKNEIALRSAGVSYFLFFALIPIMTTLVSIVVMLPFLRLEAEQVVMHLTEKLVPEAINDVHGYFVAFVQRAGVVCAVSVLVATYLLGKIIFFFEESVNHIWRLDTKRSLSRVMKKAWLVYLLAIAGVLVSVALPIRGAPGFVVGMILTSALFVAFNRILPAWPSGTQKPFRWWDLLPGSLLCGTIWYVSKWGFSMYLRRFASADHISAVLGVLPLFLGWLYFSAYMLLFSAGLNSALLSLRTRAIAT